MIECGLNVWKAVVIFRHLSSSLLCMLLCVLQTKLATQTASGQPQFEPDSEVCAQSSLSITSSEQSDTPAKICTKLCNLDCLTSLASGNVWLRCLVDECPGITKEAYTSLANDSIAVAVGAVLVPLQQEFTPSNDSHVRNNTNSNDLEPKHRHIQTSANSSFLANLRQIMRQVRGTRGSFKSLKTRVAVVQRFGTSICRRSTKAKVVFTVRSANSEQSVTVNTGQEQTLEIDIPPDESTLLFNTKVEDLSPLEADQCVSPVWIEPRLLPESAAAEKQQSSCKRHCTADLLRSGRAPLTCFVAGCSGERFRLNRSTATKQPFIIFPCNQKPSIIGIDTAVTRNTQDIRFHHDYVIEEQPHTGFVSGIGMKGSSEITFDLAMIRHNLSHVSPHTEFDLLKARVGLIPVQKRGCSWTADNLVRPMTSQQAPTPVSAKFSIFIDGQPAGSTRVTGLYSKELVGNLKLSARHLTLRVTFPDNKSRRCTRPVWSDLNLQQTQTLYFASCQQQCANMAAEGTFPLSCFTGVCTGHMARHSFRPFFWIQKHTEGVGIDITESQKIKPFRLGSQRRVLRWGLGANPPSDLVFDLNAFRRSNLTFNTFSSHLGIDVSSLCGHAFGKAEFRVYLDGRLVLGRRLLHANYNTEEFHIPVDGVRWLRLVTRFPTGRNSPGICAYAVWGDAKLWTLFGK